MTNESQTNLAREAARSTDGKFGTQPASEADVEIAAPTPDPIMDDLRNLVAIDEDLTGHVAFNRQHDMWEYVEGDTVLSIVRDGNASRVEDESADTTDAVHRTLIVPFEGRAGLTARHIRASLRRVREDRAFSLAAREFYGDLPVPGGNPGTEPDGALIVSGADGGTVQLNPAVLSEDYFSEPCLVVPFLVDDQEYVVLGDEEGTPTVMREDGTELTKREQAAALGRVDDVCETSNVMTSAFRFFDEVSR